ncbi:hypothetical protein EC575_19880, partial [Vibrio cholerae]
NITSARLEKLFFSTRLYALVMPLLNIGLACRIAGVHDKITIVKIFNIVVSNIGKILRIIGV